VPIKKEVPPRKAPQKMKSKPLRGVEENLKRKKEPGQKKGKD